MEANVSLEPNAAAVALAIGSGDTLTPNSISGAVNAQGALIPLDRLVKIYVKMRDAKSDLATRHKAELAKIEEPMAQIATELKRRALEQGTDGFKTEFGTVYLSHSLKSSCADWQLFYDWMYENKALDFLEKRISNGQVKTFMEEHEGQLPPGVNIFKEVEARVRRNSGD